MDTSDYYVGHHELRGHLTGLNFSESFSPTLSPTPQPVAVTAAPTVTPAPTAFEVSGGTKKKVAGTFAVIMMSAGSRLCLRVMSLWWCTRAAPTGYGRRIQDAHASGQWRLRRRLSRARGAVL